MNLKESDRLYFFDNLKSAVILLVIVHHAAIPYMTVQVPSWGVYDIRTHFFFDCFVSWNDSFIMPLMFFISGYFALGSLGKSSLQNYCKGKWFRIGWPWLTGVLFMVPITLSVSFMDAPWENIKTHLTSSFYSGQYWYLNLLLWFYVLLIPLKRFAVRSMTPKAPPIIFYPLMIFLAFIGLFGVNQIVSDGTWSSMMLLACQWVRVPLYLLLFLAGAYAWKNQWFTERIYLPRWYVWLPLFLLVTGGYVCVRYALYMQWFSFPENSLIFYDQFIRAILSITCTFSIIAFFRHFVNYSNLFWKKLSATAFAIYWIQQPVVEVFSQLMRTLEFSCFLKFIVVVCATTAVSYLLARYLLIKLPFFKS